MCILHLVSCSGSYSCSSIVDLRNAGLTFSSHARMCILAVYERVSCLVIEQPHQQGHGRAEIIRAVFEEGVLTFKPASIHSDLYRSEIGSKITTLRACLLVS